jgi:hypothetical protein
MSAGSTRCTCSLVTPGRRACVARWHSADVAAPGFPPFGSARAGLGAAYRRAVALVQHADPVRLALRPAPAGTAIGLACVYRARNAPVVRGLLAQLPSSASVALWCLDGPSPQDLVDRTLGSGPGTRSALLNRLVATLPASLDALVLTDDDVRFSIGDLPRLVDAGRRLRLDVYAPAHLASSHAGWDFVRRRRGTFGRVTDFVEQGPLLVLSPRGREVVLPLPEDIGMSWGVEVRWWQEARARGARLGLVDAVAVRHLSPAAGAYDRQEQERTLQAELRRGGLSSLEQLHVVRERVGLARALRLRH